MAEAGVEGAGSPPRVTAGSRRRLRGAAARLREPRGEPQGPVGPAPLPGPARPAGGMPPRRRRLRGAERSLSRI